MPPKIPRKVDRILFQLAACAATDLAAPGVREDAQRAVDLGADAIFVRNDGGRQIDGAASGITALPEIAVALVHQTEVWMDGGIQSSHDVVMAWAPKIIRDELDITMASAATRS